MNSKRISVTDLKAGDVLLSAGEISVSTFGLIDALILMLDGGLYTHAAYWDGSHLIEATTRGVVSDALDPELKGQAFVDVYRFKSDSGHHLGDKGWSAADTTKVAKSYVGAAYSYSDLVLLALLLIAKKTISFTDLELAAISLVFIEAVAVLEELSGEGKRSQICSSLIYEVFEQAVPAQYALTVSDALGGESVKDLADSFAESIKSRHSELATSVTRFAEAYVEHMGTSLPVLAGLVTPKSLQDSPNLCLVGRLEKPSLN